MAQNGICPADAAMIAIMPYDLIEQLSQLAKRRIALSKGSFLFHREDRVSELFVVRDGRIELVRHQLDGAALVLQRAGPRDVVAEASVLSERYHCDAVAASVSSVLAIPVELVRERLAEDPGFARSWTMHLTQEVQAARLRSEILSLKTVAERLDAWLAARDDAMPAKGHWKSIANEIGVSPEAFYREMARRRAHDAAF